MVKYTDLYSRETFVILGFQTEDYRMNLLFDKVALVTGASRGVGYAAARKLCEKFPGNKMIRE